MSKKLEVKSFVIKTEDLCSPMITVKPEDIRSSIESSKSNKYKKAALELAKVINSTDWSVFPEIKRERGGNEYIEIGESHPVYKAYSKFERSIPISSDRIHTEIKYFGTSGFAFSLVNEGGGGLEGDNDMFVLKMYFGLTSAKVGE